MGALAEMYVQGVTTRRVMAVTEELYGHSFSASAISAIDKKLDGELARFARRRLIRVLAAATHEDWLEVDRYLSTDFLKEARKEHLKKAA